MSFETTLKLSKFANSKYFKSFFVDHCRHKFHLVKASQLPFLMGQATFLLVTSIAFYWNESGD